MGKSAWNALAVACLALAIGAVMGSVRATLRAGEIQGPSALVVLPDGEVWLGVDRELWRISPQGALRSAQPVDAAGLPGAPANLVRGPGGTVVASVRGDATLYVLDTASARVKSTLVPRWPDDLARDGGRAINFAFDADGRIAIATGGGDAVVLFGADGAFVARTPAGAYKFTNGLWWSAEGLWTTDTNRFTLRLLDPATLQERRAVTLGEGGVGSFLGPARARTDGSPTAALIRFRGDMTEGGVALVGADARAVDLPQGATMEPRDVDWLGDELLAVDGASFSILRWSAARRIAAPFGDEALRARLAASAVERDRLRESHLHWLFGAGGALLVGVACAAAASARRRPERAPPLDLSGLGTPRLGRRALLGQQWRMHGVTALAWLPIVAMSFVPVPWLKARFGDHAVLALLGLAVVVLLSMLAALPLLLRRVKRLAQRPEYEPSFNVMAVRLLERQTPLISSVLRPGERVIETFMVQPGMGWHVLSTQRLLRFSASLFEHRLAAAHELADVSAVSTTPGGGAAVQRWWRSLAGTAWLEIAVEGHRPIRGMVGSPVLAARVAERIAALAPALRQRRAARATVSPGHTSGAAGRRWRQVWASLVVPGWGHWLQRRTGEAAALIVVWAGTVIFFTAPMLWALVERFTAVSVEYAAGLLAWHALLAAAAAVHVWRADSSVAR